MTSPADSKNPPPAEPSKRPSDADVGDGGKPVAASTRNDDDEGEWRHPPVAPVDERNPLRSLGNAIADTLTGSEADTPRQPPKR